MIKCIIDIIFKARIYKMTELLIKKLVPNSEKTHIPEVRMEYGKLAGRCGIVLNLFLFVIKFITGTLAKSISITADAVNNLTDAASSIVSLLGFVLAEKPADKEHPYGHGRYEYISALTVAAIIIVIGVELFKTGVQKIISPEAVNCSVYSIMILVVSILTKLWMSAFNVKIGKRINSKTLIATAKDSRNDVISTFAVLVSAAVAILFKINIDGFVGVAVSIFILYSGFGLIKDTISPLLGVAPDEEVVRHIHDIITSYPKVLGTHDLIIHDYGPGRCFASVHIEVAAEDDILETHDEIDNIERYFSEKEHLKLVVHMDPIVTKNEAVTDMRKKLSKMVKNIDEALSIHDLRTVPGPTHTNVIFDCVLPLEIKVSKSEIEKQISDFIKKEYGENYFPVITFDSSYVPITN